MEGLLRTFNMLICAINFPRRKGTVSVSLIWMAIRHSLTPYPQHVLFSKMKNSNESAGLGYDASTGTSILRSNSSMGKSSQSIARLKKTNKADYRTVSHFEKLEQRCTHTWEGKKNEKT